MNSKLITGKNMIIAFLHTIYQNKFGWIKELNGKQLTTTTNRNKEKLYLMLILGESMERKFQRRKIIALHKKLTFLEVKTSQRNKMPVKKKKNFGKTYSTND